MKTDFRPPTKTYQDDNVNSNFYNLTMSYKLNSDISWYYGKVIDRLTSKVVAPAFDTVWKDPEKDFHGVGE